jgi:hypothetical protein
MPYRYLRDPLFLLCLALYLTHRLNLAGTASSAFLRSYLNDLICIPFWVPILLWFLRQAGLRKDEGPPRSHEILIPLIIWSVVFEILLPHLAPFRGLAVADHLDVLCYAAGALLAALFWKWWYGASPSRPPVEPAGEAA